MDRIRAQVERAVETAVMRNALWSAGATLVVGVSGGADSLCLLGTLLALRNGHAPLAPGALIVAHLEHGLRGEQGVADARWVAEFAAEAGLRCIVERIDIRALAREQHHSIEDAARRARYTFFRRIARDIAAACICVGHTRDDQVETLVMNWLRGSGLGGLTGMAPRVRDVARPLLEVAHADTVAYCQAQGWQPREDASNSDLAYKRNRVRHELLPVLERYNPNLRQTLIRNAALLRDDNHYLENAAEAAWADVFRFATEISLTLSVATLRAHSPAIRHRLLRRAAYQLVGYDNGLEASHLLALDAALDRARAGVVLHLPGQLRARLEYDTLVLERSVHDRHAAWHGTEAESPLPIPGTVELPGLGWRVRAWHTELPAGLEPESAPAPPANIVLSHAGAAYDVGQAELRVYVDADAAGDALVARGWRPGDRFRPLGMRAEKKVQDVLSDAKVPRQQRHRLPIVSGRDHLIWLGGVRIDDRVRLTPQTRRILVLQMEPVTPGNDDRNVVTSS